ncbi:MAG: hypothetical protein QW199_01960 [Candidatus Pacearchaeota archaeon]
MRKRQKIFQCASRQGTQNTCYARGAITLYVIIAILIVVVGLFTFSIVARSRTKKAVEPEWFRDYVKGCVKQWLDRAILTVNLFACGTLPSGKPACYGQIPYFCYNDVPGQNCIPQDPLDYSSIINIVKGNVSLCINNATAEAQKKGFETTPQSFTPSNIDVNFSSTFELIKLDITAPITLKRGDLTISMSRFDVETENKGQIVWGNLEMFRDVVNSIVQLESIGDYTLNELAENQEIFKDVIISIEDGNPFYPFGGGTRVYALEKQGQKFKFAIREIKY